MLAATFRPVALWAPARVFAGRQTGSVLMPFGQIILCILLSVDLCLLAS